MNTIKLLDCTLRDGGYINNWEFGLDNIKKSITELENSNVDIIELGFLKNESYKMDRTVFNSIDQIKKLIPSKKIGVDYAAMIEVVNPIPLGMVAEKTDDGIDIIRVIVWKTKHDENGNVVDALEEGYNYCKGIVEKGYKLCVQPARVDQYSDEEFIKMLTMFKTLNPLAVYVVDSWGTQNAEQIMHYVGLADSILDENIAIGYHGHNNMMQAFHNAVEFISKDYRRDIIVDASIYGIGRGAGNLNTEIFAKYLNDEKGTNYNTVPMVNIYEMYVKDIFNEHIWGYCIPYYLTAKYNCNPNYGEYYGMKLSLDSREIEEILQMLSDEDKVIFSKAKAERYYKEFLER